MALVHLEHVTKRFGADRPPATDGLSFTVESGRILALLGPSGCGKTTTLRLIAGASWSDRKSTRLNSSHGYISYAVFCLKKKKKKMNSEHERKDVHNLIAC